MADVKRTSGFDTGCVLLVEGFPSDAELDRFVKSEIRYMKGLDMGAYRCVALRLKFVLSGMSHFSSFVKELSESYPGLVFRLLTVPPGDSFRRRTDELYSVYRAGRALNRSETVALPGPPIGPDDLADHESRFPPLETLYETFS
jgi:hypothetical protein